MRHILTLLISFALSACLVGAGRGETKTVFIDDPGNGPIHTQTYTTNTSGMYAGGGMPAMPGAVYGNGTYGMQAGGGNASCAFHPDNCVASYSVTLVQPTVTVTSTGGVGPVSVTGDPQRAELVRRHEQAIKLLAAKSREADRRYCVLLLKSPESIEDEEERARSVADCSKLLGKTPQPATTPEAPAEAGEEKK